MKKMAFVLCLLSSATAFAGTFEVTANQRCVQYVSVPDHGSCPTNVYCTISGTYQASSCPDAYEKLRTSNDCCAAMGAENNFFYKNTCKEL